MNLAEIKDHPYYSRLYRDRLLWGGGHYFLTDSDDFPDCEICGEPLSNESGEIVRADGSRAMADVTCMGEGDELA